MWFATGIVMMYARMPHLAPAERLSRLEPLDLATVTVSPAQAAERLHMTPDRVRVAMLYGRPVYRLAAAGAWGTVFADDGERLVGLSRAQTLRLAQRFAGSDASPVYETTLREPDQWTLESGPFFPLHRVGLDDDIDTKIYLSDRTGEIVMKTTRPSRRWAYLGAVLHWLYFTPFRSHSDLWIRSVTWLAIGGCLLTLSGLVWGVWRFAEKRSPPYTGAMRWHHYAGLVFGLFTFTWILSGCLTLGPLNWPTTVPTAQQRSAVRGGALRLDGLTTAALRAGFEALSTSFSPGEADVLQFRGELLLVAYRAPSGETAKSSGRKGVSELLSAVAPFEHRVVALASPQEGSFERFDNETMLAAAREAMPSARLVDTTWLREYDGYYYDRDAEQPLPVLRARYDDPQETSLYLEPKRGLILHKEERLSRLNRWLSGSLHSLDFPFLYDRRPLWNVVVIVLSLCCIALVLTSLPPGWLRLGRHLRRLFGFKQGRESD